MTKTRSTKGPSQRQLRVGELIRHALADIFLSDQIEDEEISGRIISVAEVRASPDLRHATAYVAAVDQGNNEELARALNRHQRFLRGELARRVELRYVPEIVFRADQTAEAASRVEEILRSPDVARDLK
jgi:ribosome-binding factor A